MRLKGFIYISTLISLSIVMFSEESQAISA